jgi:hypothetical protein
MTDSVFVMTDSAFVVTDSAFVVTDSAFVVRNREERIPCSGEVEPEGGEGKTVKR